jgi:hypothetical protein
MKLQLRRVAIALALPVLSSSSIIVVKMEKQSEQINSIFTIHKLHMCIASG